MKELPETDEAVAQWCRDIFVAKVHVERTFLLFYYYLYFFFITGSTYWLMWCELIVSFFYM